MGVTSRDRRLDGIRYRNGIQVSSGISFRLGLPAAGQGISPAFSSE